MAFATIAKLYREVQAAHALALGKGDICKGAGVEQACKGAVCLRIGSRKHGCSKACEVEVGERKAMIYGNKALDFIGRRRLSITKSRCSSEPPH